MFRRIISLLAATAVAFAVLPALIAAAAPAGTASLIQGADIFPGANTFQVTITNDEPTGGLLQEGGNPINGIEILNPSGFRDVVCVASGDFTCAVDRNDLLLFGAELDPGDDVTVEFTSNVNSPFDRDRVQNIDPRVTDDNFSTMESLGNLPVATRALQIVPGSLKPLSPSGVLDNSGTTGQDITYGYTVKSFAQSSITVTPTLTSDGNESITAIAPVTILPGATVTPSFDITLGSQANGQRSVKFTAGIDSPDVEAAVVDNTNFVVQAKPRLTLQAGTFAPAFVRSDGTDYEFSISGSKVNPPTITGLTGTFEFADTTATVNLPDTIAANGANGLSFTYQPTEVTGADALYDGQFSFSGTDGNGEAWEQTMAPLLDLVTIDNINPLVTVTLDAPTGQLAAKNGDSVSLEVTVDGGFISESVKVKSVDEDGSEIEFATGCTVGSASCNVSVPVSGLTTYGTLSATAFAKDEALNIGTGVSADLGYDAIIPDVADGPLIVNGSDYGSSAVTVVEVLVSDRNDVFGGCDAAFWDIAENGAMGSPTDFITVEEVLYSTGDTCNAADSPTAPGANPGDGIRILVPNQELTPQEVYNVKYFEENTLGFGNTSPLSDTALNEALEDIVDTVDGVKPNQPIINLVERNTNTGDVADRETAVLDNGTYWTRFAGDDLLIESFQNTLGGYSVDVRDENGDSLGTDADGEDVLVPIGATEGTYIREVLFINGYGIEGTPLTISVTLDQTAPLISASDVGINGTDSNDVTVTFDEIIWAGAPRPLDWFALEENNFPGEGDEEYHQSRGTSVTGAGNIRIIEDVNFTGEGDFAGVDYSFRSAQAQSVGQDRLEDRAGNYLQDAVYLVPVTP